MKRNIMLGALALLGMATAPAIMADIPEEIVYSYVNPEEEPDDIWEDWQKFTTCDVEWGEFDGGYFTYDMPVYKRVSKDPENHKFQFAFIKWFPLGPTMVVEYDPDTKIFRIPVQWRGANNAWDGEPHLTCGWREYYGTDDPYSSWDDVNGIMQLYTMSYYPNQDLGDGTFGNKPTTPIVDLIRMKGFTKYDIDINVPECVSSRNMKVTLSMTPHPKNVSWELVNDLVLPSDTEIIDRIANDKKNPIAETTEVDMEFREGVNTVVCISYDDKDERVVSTKAVYCMPDENENWKSIGKGYFTEDALTELGSEFTPTRLEVAVEEDLRKPGRYRIVNPYKGLPDVWSNFSYICNDHNHYIYLDASRPNAVLLEACPTGIYDPRIFASYLTSKAYEEKRIGKLQPEWIGMCGKLENGVISFPKESIGVRIPDYTAALGTDYIYWVNYNEEFKVELPNTAVETIGTDIDTPVEYYDFQGMRLDNPADGTPVIMVKGGHASKIIYRK